MGSSEKVGGRGSKKLWGENGLLLPVPCFSCLFWKYCGRLMRFHESRKRGDATDYVFAFVSVLVKLCWAGLSAAERLLIRRFQLPQQHFWSAGSVSCSGNRVCRCSLDVVQRLCACGQSTPSNRAASSAIENLRASAEGRFYKLCVRVACALYL